MMVRWMGRLQVNAHLDVPMLLPKAKVDCWSWCLLRSMSDPFVVSTCVVWECRDNQRQHPSIPSKWQGWVCQKNLVWGTNKQGLTLITDPLLHVHFASCMAVLLHHVTRKPSPLSDRIFHPGWSRATAITIEQTDMTRPSFMLLLHSITFAPLNLAGTSFHPWLQHVSDVLTPISGNALIYLKWHTCSLWIDITSGNKNKPF